jgi:hypothetical protein
MSFFRNDAINRVNLHSGIQALAQGAGTLFVLVFLLRAGVPAPAALVAQAAILAGRFALRPAILPLATRFGVKPLLLGGTLALALHYPLLAEVHGVGVLLVLLCLVTAAGEIFYYLAYHACFAMLGDAERRGRQVSIREALIAAAGVVAPLLGASGLVVLGARATFGVVAAVQLLAAVPLLGLPDLPVRRAAPGAFRAARRAAAIIAGDGWFDGFFLYVWQIALFMSLGESFLAYGGAMALAGLAGAACGLLLGRHVDAGHGRRVVAIGYGLAAAVVLLRALSLGSPWLAVAANALGALLMPILLPSLATATYNMTKASPCPFRFQMATEAGWDVGGLSACLVAAMLLAAGVPLRIVLILALPGLALAASLLWRYYSAQPPSRAVPAAPTTP